MERTLIHIQLFTATMRSLIADISDGDLSKERRAQAEKDLRHLMDDFLFLCGPNNEHVMPKLAERVRREFYPIL